MTSLIGHQVIRNPHKKPHYYQRDAVQATEGAFEIDGWVKALIDIPTGGGKSFVTGELCAREIERGGRALFLAHTKELVKQPRLSFEEDFGCQSTIEMGSKSADDSPMVFASVQTMVNRVKSGMWKPDTFGTVIVDEAHRTLSDSHSFVAKFFEKGGAKIVGCTATPPARGQEGLAHLL